MEYFPAATGMEIKSGLIDEASDCQTFHLESKDKIRLRDRKIFYPRPPASTKAGGLGLDFFMSPKSHFLSSANGSKSILPLREHVRGSDISATDQSGHTCFSRELLHWMLQSLLVPRLVDTKHDEGRPICEKKVIGHSSFTKFKVELTLSWGME